MEEKISSLLGRFDEIEAQLADPAVISDQKRYKKLSQEHAYLSDVREVWTELESVRSELREAESDAEMRELLGDEIERAKAREGELAAKLQNLLVPPDPNDHRNTILELRAGTGGDEAALFVGDCVRMYKLFADEQGWKHEQLGSTPSDAGGYKEYVMVLSGRNVHRLLQYEGGTHRVQRVPVTETQGRIHTSAITVAVLLEPDEEEDFALDDKDLRIETCRASGAGGQHVNTTDSAIRIVHLPTGLVATCQDERSQIKNKDKALRMLKAKIVQAERDRKAAELASARAAQVGSGDRSERIRTYNFPQNRVTDHRINLTLHNLDRVMDGDLAAIVEALVAQLRQ